MGEFAEAVQVFAFSGIADNEGFYRSLQTSGMPLAGTMAFPDHHWYGQHDLDRIRLAAERSGAERLVTTAKDYVRFADRVRWPLDLIVMDLNLQFGAPTDGFENYLTQCLERIVKGGEKGRE